MHITLSDLFLQINKKNQKNKQNKQKKVLFVSNILKNTADQISSQIQKRGK